MGTGVLLRIKGRAFNFETENCFMFCVNTKNCYKICDSYKRAELDFLVLPFAL